MKILITLIVVLIFVGCKPPVSVSKNVTEEAPKQMIDDLYYKVQKIDGCEYIILERNVGFPYGLYSITHKGNCNNPIHQYNK